MCRDIKEYPNVGHCFMNDPQIRGPLRVVQSIARMSYSAPEAEDAWQRIFAFFGEHLK
jgi:carboxymethylenebutenolidase